MPDSANFGIEEGIYTDVPMEQYIDAPVTTRSSLVKFLESPAQYQHGSGRRRSPSADMVFGSYVNDLLLDPEAAKGYAGIPPEFSDLRRKGSKAFHEGLKRTHGEDKVLKMERMFDGQSLAQKIREHPEGQRMLSGKPEVSLCWEEYGVMLGGRPDSVVYEKEGEHFTIYDLKCTHDPHPIEFRKKFHSLGYYVQAGLYRRGLIHLMAKKGKEIDVTCRYVVAGSGSPNLIAVYEVHNSLLEWVDALLDDLIEAFSICYHTDTWPGFSDAPMPIGLPGYATMQIDSAIRRITDLVADIPLDSPSAESTL